MTPQEIAARLIEIHTVLVDRFDAQPWIEPSANVLQSGKVSIQIYAPNGTDGELGKLLKIAMGETFEEALDTAIAFVTALPPANETKRIDWQRRLGNLIDDGREIGIETEFLNPLEASMKRLASNALTHEAAQ